MSVDEIDTIGPSGVGALGSVAELVEHSWKFDSELPHTGASDQAALLFVLGASKNDFVLDVALHLPDVARVSFENVDDQKGDAISILIEEFVKGGNLPPERRSSVAAEDEDNRLVRSKRGKLDTAAFVELHQGEVGCRIAEVKFAGASVRPESFEGECKKDRWAWHARHDARELFGRLTHCPSDENGEAEVEDDKDDQRANDKPFVRVPHPHGLHMVPGDGVESSSGFQLRGYEIRGGGWIVRARSALQRREKEKPLPTE